MTAPKIEKLLTPYNFTNANNVGRIKYIVIHYVGALGGAWANCHYYASKYLGASAHYFVGFEGEISFVTNVVNAVVALFRGDFSGALDFASAAADDFKNFILNGFDAILSFIGGFASGFLDAVGGALSAIGIDASETISKMKDTVLRDQHINRRKA